MLPIYYLNLISECSVIASHYFFCLQPFTGLYYQEKEPPPTSHFSYIRLEKAAEWIGQNVMLTTTKINVMIMTSIKIAEDK